MMILSLVAMTVLEKYCITSASLQWLFHSGERAVGLLFFNEHMLVTLAAVFYFSLSGFNNP